MGISLEVAQLKFNSEDFGVEEITFKPEYGFIIIKLNLLLLGVKE